MNTEQTIPRLSYPFPDRVNIHLDAIERQVSLWIDEYDFFSYEKERHDHEAMNLISVIQYEQQWSVEEAKIQALAIHDTDLA